MARRSIPRARLGRLTGDPPGLSSPEAERRRREYGANDIVEAPPHPWWALLGDTLKDPMVWFFAGVGVVYVLIGQRTEAVTLLIAIIPLVGMDFYLHRRTQASTAGLNTRLATTAQVFRDGSRITVASADVVPGDHLVIPPGQPFPADGVVMAGVGLQVDESVLTGEAYPVAKEALDELPPAVDDPLVEEAHWVFAGTRLLTGEAQVRAVYTGAETIYGEIVRSAIRGTHELTPLQAAIGRLVRILIAVAVAVCLGLAAVRLYQGFGWLDALISAATLATAAIPEEFSVVFTFFLGVGVYRMAQRHALVRRAVTVENVGRVSCICSDKTGTITEGRLRLEHVLPAPAHDEECVLRLASLASRTDSGDPMDEAVFAASKAKGVSRIDHERLATFPFTEDRKRETTILRDGNGQLLAVTKGAAEVILAMSSLDQPARAAWQEEIAWLADGAHKVIAVASRCLDALAEAGREPDSEFAFAGLLGFEDPVRDGVREAVDECQAAGIHPIMVTGDHPKTALAVARSIRIGGEAPRLVTGEELEALVARPDKENLRPIDVIARAKPAEKLMLVRSLQSGGDIVAVTGDGVNDVPALQAADVGVAMGERGTRSAREVAAIVLLDDNFRTIVGAIREGRQLFENLRASFQYLLIVHIPFVVTATLIPFAGYPLLYQPIHIVWLELVIHPTAMLSFQAPADRVLARRTDKLARAQFFTRGEWATVLVAGVLIAAMVTAGYVRSLEGARNVEHGRAMALATFNISGAFAAAALGRLRTPAAWVIGASTVVLSFLLIQLPHVSQLLQLQPLHPDDWALVAAAGLVASSVPLVSGVVRSRFFRAGAAYR